MIMNTGFLMWLELDNVVLADHRFAISNDIALHGASLVIPSFTRGKKQLGLHDVECSQRITKVHINVELVTGLLIIGRLFFNIHYLSHFYNVNMTQSMPLLTSL